MTTPNIEVVADAACPEDTALLVPMLQGPDGVWRRDAVHAVAIRIAKPRPLPPRTEEHGSRNDRDQRNTN